MPDSLRLQLRQRGDRGDFPAAARPASPPNRGRPGYRASCGKSLSVLMDCGSAIVERIVVVALGLDDCAVQTLITFSSFALALIRRYRISLTAVIGIEIPLG